MGSALNSVMLAAFADELEKMGAIPLEGLGRAILSGSVGNVGRVGQAVRSFARSQTVGPGGMGEALWRLKHPIQGTIKGFREMSPRYRPQELEKIRGAVQQVPAGTKKLFGGASAGHLLEHPTEVPLASILRGTAEGVPASRVQALAEELSRRGWTGGGRVTKYLPMGSKGMTAAFTAPAIPSILSAEKPTPTGEGGVLEKGLGEVGGLGGFVMGSGLGLVPSMGLWYGLQRGGSALGRVLDRLRAGADLRTAVTAPTKGAE